jgi:hypothetical protein
MGDHKYVSNKCMICTSCGVCTGYGAGCCECTGKDRSGDKGKECGCGAGKSGCSNCGQCEKCGANSRCSVPHKGSFSGCGGNPDGISSTRGAGNCDRSSCDNCGAGTHWTCCGDTRQSSTHCLPHITEQQAMLNKEAMFSPHSAIRNRDMPGVWYGGSPAKPAAPAPAAVTAHNHVSNKCMICTSCGVCTGFGAGCVRCKGKDRSGDKGEECGCGGGKSGCSNCGQCEKCATGVCEGKVSTASMATATVNATGAPLAAAAATAIPSGDKGIADSIERALRKGKKKWGRSKIMIVGKFVIFLFGLLFVC